MSVAEYYEAHFPGTTVAAKARADETTAHNDAISKWFIECL